MLLHLSTLLLAIGPPGPVEGVSSSEGVERQTLAMGTYLRVEVEAEDRAAGLAASEAAIQAVLAVERRLSTWTEESELARFNRTPVGEPFRPSRELADELSRALRLRADTDRAFDPGVGALVEAWGLRTGGRRASDEELAAALAPAGLAALTIDAEGTLVRNHAALRVEEGAFGKGAALDAALEALRASGAGSALVDLGGQVAVLDGPDTAAAPRRIPIAHPDERDLAALVIALPHGSLATSGNSERGIEVDGVRRSHVMDPRSGRPAPDFGSVSVWAADAFEADALSTALFVMGPERGATWAAARDGVEALYLVRTGDHVSAVATDGLRDHVIDTLHDLPIEFVEPPLSDLSIPHQKISADHAR